MRTCEDVVYKIVATSQIPWVGLNTIEDEDVWIYVGPSVQRGNGGFVHGEKQFVTTWPRDEAMV